MVIIVGICRAGEFECVSDRSCVPESHRCDGAPDCPDASDEANCAATERPTKCLLDEFECATRRRCVPAIRRCDGRDDCRDGSDEANCPVTSQPGECLRIKSRCANGIRYLLMNKICDRVDDCGDGCDEINSRREILGARAPLPLMFDTYGHNENSGLAIMGVTSEEN